MELGAGFWFRMCQTEQIGLPRDCSFKEHASTRPDALAKPSSTHSAFYKPPSCHFGGWEALSPTEDGLPALPTLDFLGGGGYRLPSSLDPPWPLATVSTF